MNRLIKALMILNLEILLMVPTCVPQTEDRGSKSGDQYWADTGLGSTELESLISNSSCYSGQQTFLACVNALEQMAERYNLIVTETGSFRPLQKQDIEGRVTEKKELASWLPLFEKEKTNPQFSFINLWHELDSKFIPATERSSVISNGINGFLSIYKDPHTYIMPLAMYEEVIANSESHNTNVGFVARRIDGEMVVRKVYEGSPAALAGIHKGDRIISINDEKVADILPSRVSDLLRMRSANRIGFHIERKSLHSNQDIEKKYIEVMKSENTYPSVISQLLEGQHRVGLVTIHKFSHGVCEMTRTQLLSLKEQNIQGVMLDLRDNPGGQVEEASCIANLFVDKGTFLFETRYLDTSKPSDRYIAEKDPIYKGPLAILINSGSASASEIVAGALRDQNRAKLIGERSFGKGSFQDGRVWGPNPKVALFETQGLYYFPSGWTPQLVGLEPDIQVTFNNADNQREQELFLNPIMPIDRWTGPQSLSWLTEKDCDMEASLMDQMSNLTSGLTSDDPQMQKAQAWLSCGEKHDRHGSL